MIHVIDISICCYMNLVVTKDEFMECFDNWCILIFYVLELLDLGILLFYIFSITIAKHFKMSEKIVPYQFFSKGFYIEKDFNKLLTINCYRMLIFYKFSIIVAINFDKMLEKIYQVHSKPIYSEKNFNETINTNCNRTFPKNRYKNLNKFDNKIGKSLENNTFKNPHVNVYNNFNKNFDIILLKLSLNLFTVNFFKANFLENFSYHTVFLQNILSLNNIIFYHGS